MGQLLEDNMADRELLQQQSPVRRPRDESQNGTSATATAGEALETGTAAASADNGTSNLSAVIPGWFFEINSMWPGTFFDSLSPLPLFSAFFSCEIGELGFVILGFDYGSGDMEFKQNKFLPAEKNLSILFTSPSLTYLTTTFQFSLQNCIWRPILERGTKAVLQYLKNKLPEQQ
ncbi:hypothetical protein LINPERHAP2_LOCUS20797 [Linum perenne]